MKQFCVIVLLSLFCIFGLGQQVFAQVDTHSPHMEPVFYSPASNRELSFNAEFSLTMGIGMGLYAYHNPKIAGAGLVLSGALAWYAGEFRALALAEAVAYYNYVILTKELQAAPTGAAERPIRLKSFFVNAIATTLIFYWMLDPDGRSEVFTYHDPAGSFSLTPYEDSFALNYHLRF